MTPLRRHDRYLLKAWWSSFGAVLLFFTIVVLVIDLSDRLTRLGRNWASLEEEGRNPLMLTLEFYGTLLPFLWMRILPFAAAMAGGLCLARMIRHNELVALLVGGVSKRRLARPFLLSGVLVAGLIFAVQEGVAPRLSRRHNELLRVLGKATPGRIPDVSHFHDPGGGRLSMAGYLPLERGMEAAQVTFRDETGAATAIYRYPLLLWDDDAERWLAPQGGLHVPLSRDRTGMARVAIEAGSAAPLEASLPLVEISLTRRRTLGYSLAEMRELVRANPDTPRLVLEQHALFTQPLSAVVMLLLTLPFAFPVGRRRATTLGSLLVSGLIGSLYFAATYLTGSLASAGDLNPVVLAWLPSVVFAALGLAFYATMDD
jgi:lipopolysaccharide export system permease protein